MTIRSCLDIIWILSVHCNLSFDNFPNRFEFCLQAAIVSRFESRLKAGLKTADDYFIAEVKIAKH